MIYLVEDDDSIRELITYTLRRQDMEAEGFSRPADFWEAMARRRPDLVLLDIMLPEEDGLSILKKIRRASDTKDLPVVMLTAKGSEYDTVLGLDTGADDYIPKPFRMMELLARIRALLRRVEPSETGRDYRLDGLYVCPARHVVQVDGQDVSLTLKEFELLTLLFSEQGTVLTRGQLLDQIWGYAFDGESRTVDVHVRTLRQKLGEAGACIETVRGVGYKIRGEKH